MAQVSRTSRLLAGFYWGLALGFCSITIAREFPPGAIRAVVDLPVSQLRTRIEKLPPEPQARAIAWLGNVHFTDADLETLRVDTQGGIFYADAFVLPNAPLKAAKADILTEPASIPVGPLPAHLLFHSKPGAANVLYLNFSGEVVSGTAWNDVYARLDAVPFSIDGDYTTFNDAEQLAIKRVWERVSEDYAPFNIDVTTARPASFTATTAHALITRSTDANGNPNPSAGSGGVAYLDVFGSANYSTYRPAWIFFDALASDESYIGDAVSHEIGHNLGLSHDGTTDGGTYYRGHGDGETSWAPIMGSAYYRNVSQWSKGEYYHADNTQDDLAIISGKLTYRSDDHGNTAGSATPLTAIGGTTVLATNPENDPANTNSSNKGILERSTDVDVFSFATGNGPVDLAINPWIMLSGMRGGNVDLLVELRSASGSLLISDNATASTAARIQTSLAEGVYYLHIRATGVGNPTVSSPTGYTSYASMGQYFITGSVVRSSIAIPPGAELQVTDLNEPLNGPKNFTVTYTDNIGILVSSLDDNDIIVTGPNNYRQSARLVSVNSLTDGTPRVATYSIEPPNGATWSQVDNGSYFLSMQASQVLDTEGASVAPAELGGFNVAVPSVIYFASLDTDPGWTMERLWQYGLPAYGSSGPTAGFTGTKIIAYNLSGNYENNLPATYATTPSIDCSSAASLVLRFQRWLRLRNGDTAVIQISTNGSAWTDLWSTTRTVSDSAWQLVEYPLPSWASGSRSVRIRWGIASGSSQNDLGWNIDDVQILGNPTTDTTPPSAALQVANIVDEGSANHPLTVTYTDDSAVRVSSLGASDVVVTGPNGYSNVATFVSVDNPADGSPRIVTYSIPPSGGTWDVTDNGSYQVFLQADEISDIHNNLSAGQLLGTFTIGINSTPQSLVVSPIDLLIPEGGTETVTVRLAVQPAADVSVSVLRASGQTNLFVQGNSAFTFNSQNWSNPVPVIVASLPDPDQSNGTAIFECRSEGLATVIINATEQDSTPDNVLTITVNDPTRGTVTPGSGTYPVGATVQLTATPNAGYAFLEWRGSYSTANNPISVLLETNVTLEAVFIEAPTPQALIVNTAALEINEGSNAIFTIRLARPPVEDMIVSVVARVTNNIVVQSGATNLFTSVNWSNPQPVVLACLPDFDRISQSTVFDCVAVGLPSVFVQVTEQDATPQFDFVASVNNSNWGAVTLTGGAYPAGDTIQITATPSNYFHFVSWTGGYTGSNNPVTLVLISDLTVEALFAETVTGDHNVPLWWLAEHGYTSDFDSAQDVIGSNGMPLWQSYVAGLDPWDPASQLRLSFELGADPTEHILRWKTETGRVYSILQTTDLSAGFITLAGASDLPAAIHSITNRSIGSVFYRLQVRKP